MYLKKNPKDKIIKKIVMINLKRMLSKKIVFVIFIILFSCKQYNQSNINNLTIYKIDLNTNTSVQADCYDFQELFSDILEKYQIKDKTILNELGALLTNIERDNLNADMDVRKKIIISYSNKNNDTLCVDKFNISINGKVVKKNRKLHQFLLDL